MEDVIHLLNYAATHPDVSIQYHASCMVLDVDSAYLSVRKARSRVGGFRYLSSVLTNVKKPPVMTQPLNGPLHAVYTTIENVMASASEAEMGALFINGQKVMILRTILYALGHQQPPTPIRKDNSTVSSITNNTIRQRRSQSMDMRFYWVRDRVQQGQLIVYWGPGAENKGNFYTKHHHPTHCRSQRNHHVHQQEDNNSHKILQGCANLGINLDTRTKGLIPRSRTQNQRLRLSHVLIPYLEKYRPLGRSLYRTDNYQPLIIQ